MNNDKYVFQFSVDILKNDKNIDVEDIIDILESAGYIVLGGSWKATWTEDGYNKGASPISYN